MSAPTDDTRLTSFHWHLAGNGLGMIYASAEKIQTLADKFYAEGERDAPSRSIRLYLIAFLARQIQDVAKELDDGYCL